MPPKDDPATVVVPDAVGDAVTRDVDRPADIRAIYSYVVNDKWVIELAAAMPVTGNVIYRMHARLFFEDQSPKRFDLIYEKGDTVLKKYAHNSLMSIPGMKTSKVNGRWRTEIPIASLGNLRAVFINADSGSERFTVDKTAWRMLRIKD